MRNADVLNTAKNVVPAYHFCVVLVINIAACLTNELIIELPINFTRDFHALAHRPYYLPVYLHLVHQPMLNHKFRHQLKYTLQIHIVVGD